MTTSLNQDSLENSDDLTAVEKFAIQHDFKQFARGQAVYQDLIPKQTPGPGQQYAFAVDLDRCTGCKGCITACHNENGLDEDETWRAVGLIQGGSSEEPFLQHVTTACHHCVEPSCMQGCPTKAYIKDPETGIVRHLEDQCFGCQYCILKCPYDVPKYNKKKGIVHKCDMCISRLKAGEAPACVRGCPTSAISITLVNTEDARNRFTEFVNVPTAPASDYTFPTTVYKTQKKFPANMVSVDHFVLEPEHSHFPLVVMLVLTQLSVGTFLLDIIFKIWGNGNLNEFFFSIHRLVALGIGLLALGASVLHLGRPLYAFRAVLGLKTSWLSREILAFAVFSFLAIVYALSLHPYSSSGGWGGENLLGVGVFLSGLAGVLCSVMVYRDTHRPFWDNHTTTAKFLLTTGILGSAVSLTVIAVSAFVQRQEIDGMFIKSIQQKLCWSILGCSLLKMILELRTFLTLKSNDNDFIKKSAILMIDHLRKFTTGRFVFGVLGGILLPVLLLTRSFPVSSESLFVSGYSVLLLLFVLVGEFFERYLFFRAVVPLKMPGGKIN